MKPDGAYRLPPAGPGFAAKLAMGEMADELLLSSARVATGTSYVFRYPELERALRHMLGR